MKNQVSAFLLLVDIAVVLLMERVSSNRAPELEKDLDSTPSYWRKTHGGKPASPETELGRLLRNRERPRWEGSGLWGRSCSQQLDGCPLWNWSMGQFMNLKHIFQPYGIFLMICSQQSSVIIVNRCSFCPVSQGIKIHVMFENVCFSHSLLKQFLSTRSAESRALADTVNIITSKF